MNPEWVAVCAPLSLAMLAFLTAANDTDDTNRAAYLVGVAIMAFLDGAAFGATIIAHLQWAQP